MPPITHISGCPSSSSTMAEHALERGPLSGAIARHRPPVNIEQSAVAWHLADPRATMPCSTTSLHALQEKVRRSKEGFEPAADAVQRAVRHERRAREQAQDQIIAEPVEVARQVERASAAT